MAAAQEAIAASRTRPAIRNTAIHVRPAARRCGIPMLKIPSTPQAGIYVAAAVSSTRRPNSRGKTAPAMASSEVTISALPTLVSSVAR